MKHPLWFLLYGGTSVDGRGPGEYIGRTTDMMEAAQHLDRLGDNPYSTGYVLVVRDRTTTLCYNTYALSTTCNAL